MNNFLKRILSTIILIPLALYFIIHGSYMLIFFIATCFLVACYEWHMMTVKKTFRIYGFFFLFVSFYTFYELELTIVLFVILICVSTDIGGYVFGKIFKGPKLTKISPNKTIIGSVGSFLISATTIFILTFIFFGVYGLNILFVGLATSLACQIGDLFFSYLKRKAKLKDYGKYLPGHGGVLDRLDGIFLGVPSGLFSLAMLN